jgi:glutamate-1-semialdehyde 2,1-aminomutase
MGYACLFAVSCLNSRGQADDFYRTLMMQEMIARGVLFQGLFYPTWSHQKSEMDHIAMAFNESCEIYKRAIEIGTTDSLLIGRPAKPVFRAKI